MTPAERVERVMDVLTSGEASVEVGAWTWGALEKIHKAAPEALTAAQERFLAGVEREVLGEGATA